MGEKLALIEVQLEKSESKVALLTTQEAESAQEYRHEKNIMIRRLDETTTLLKKC